MNSPAPKLTSRVGYLLGLGMLAKFFVDTANQLFNPYLMIYAAGIGVSGITMGKMISLRNLSGLIAPVIGSLADRYGYRRLMRLNLLLAALGLLLFALGNRMVPILLGMVIWGVGQGGYTPNVHSYLSSRLPYKKRSRYLGMLEYSWAMAGIVGLSLTGLIIQGVSWRLPLFLLSGGLAGSALLMGTLPRNSMTSEVPSVKPTPKGWSAAQLRDFFHLGPHSRSAWAAVAVNVFNFFAAFHIIITHGAYLDIEFGLTPARLGSVALVMGLVDWSASILVSTVGDRIGKRRSMMIGSIGLILSSLLLPFMKGSLIIAIIGLMTPRFFFEFATVSNFPLLSEQYPAGRGKVLAMGIAGGLIGATIAAATGPAAYLKAGLWGLGPVSAATASVSLLLLVFIVKDRPGNGLDSSSEVNL
ncbi:MAG: MFS transporter [Spirochaetaceae bacterium]|nr:MFS transporter [Spirochaetaceae bacterium]MDT8297612.1 MFS transporter [Spirochaetaceae bacterium]